MTVPGLPTHALVVAGRGRLKEFVQNTRSNDAVIVRCPTQSRIIISANQRLAGIVAVGCRDSELTVLDSAVISSRSLRLVDCENVALYCEDVDLRRIELFRCRGCTITVVGDDILLSVMYVITREGCLNNCFAIGTYESALFLPPPIKCDPLLTAGIPDSLNGKQYYTNVPFPGKIQSVVLAIDSTLTPEGASLQEQLATFTRPTMFGQADLDCLLASESIPTADDVLAAIRVLEETPYTGTIDELEQQYDLERLEFFEEASVMLPKVREVVRFLRQSLYCVIYTGAGISTSAKIPDFRGPAGVWTLKDKGIVQIPVKKIIDTRPTYAHYAITELARRGIVKFVVTTNFDGLHWRTGLPLHLLEELHGSCFSLFCEKCQAFSRRPYEIMGGNDKHQTAELCSWCGGTLLDTGVAFGENYRSDLEPIVTRYHAEKADLAIVLGSSMCVQSAAMYPLAVVGKGNLVIVNAQNTPVDDLAAIRVYGHTDLFMQLLMEELRIQDFDRESDVRAELSAKYKETGRRFQ